MVDIYAETKEANTSPNSPFGKNVSIAGYAKSCPSLSFSIFGKALLIDSMSGKTINDANATIIQGQGLKA